MVVREILNILKADQELKELLKPIVTDGKFYLESTSTKDEGVVYKYAQITNDGVKAQSRFEVDCISSNYVTAYDTVERIKNLLITLGDSSLSRQIIDVKQNGGGYMFEKELKLHIFKAIFILKERVR